MKWINKVRIVTKAKLLIACIIKHTILALLIIGGFLVFKAALT